MRNLTAETVPDRKKLIMPHFVVEGKGVRDEIPSMPGIARISVDNLMKDLESDAKLGIQSVLLFGIPALKDGNASGAYAKDGVIQKAVREIKRAYPGAPGHHRRVPVRIHRATDTAASLPTAKC